MSDTLAVVVPLTDDVPARQAYTCAARELHRVAQLAGYQITADPVLAYLDDGPALLARAPATRTTPPETEWLTVDEAIPWHTQRVDAVKALTGQGLSVDEIAATARLPRSEIQALHAEAFQGAL